MPGKFTGVTLACEGQGAPTAHKMVLAASSPSTTTMEKFKEQIKRRKDRRGCKGHLKGVQCKGCHGCKSCVGCKGCKLEKHTIHTHKWKPWPPSHLTFRIRATMERVDGAELARSERYLSPEGQARLEESEDKQWEQQLWCHNTGCPDHYNTWILSVGQIPKMEEEVKEERVEEEEERQEWLQVLWSKVGEEMEEEMSHDTVAEVEESHDTVAGVEECHEAVAEVEERHDTVAGVEERLEAVDGVRGRRRRRGQGSGRRRLLNFHLLLERRGLPTSRLLHRLRGTDHGSTSLWDRREEELSASPQLRRTSGGRREEEGEREWEEEEGGGVRCSDTEEEFARKNTDISMRLFSEVIKPKPSLPPPTTPTPPTTPATHKPSQFLQQRGVIPFPHLPSTPTTYTPTFPFTPPPLSPFISPSTLPFTPYQPILQCGQTTGPLQVFCHGCNQFPFMVSIYT